MHLSRSPELVTEIDALAERHGGRIGLDAVPLGRRLRRTVAPCLAPHRAWTWDRRDRRDPAWWPQGVAIAPAGGRYAGLVATTWYATSGGARLSLLDVRRRRYAHVTLVVPTATGHEPLRIHAGGLAWHDGLIYVAATKAGLWVCDPADVVRTASGEHLLPVRARLVPEDQDDEPLRFSFVTIDDATDPPRLVVGEYGSRRQTRRLAEMPVDGGPVTVVPHDIARAQGVIRVRGRLYVSSSHGPWGLGSVWSGELGGFREHRRALPMGPEDLSYDPRTDRLWTVTEHPRRRWVVSVRLSRFGG